jgi:hypothetical protein
MEDLLAFGRPCDQRFYHCADPGRRRFRRHEDVTELSVIGDDQ